MALLPRVGKSGVVACCAGRSLTGLVSRPPSASQRASRRPAVFLRVTCRPRPGGPVAAPGAGRGQRHLSGVERRPGLFAGRSRPCRYGCKRDVTAVHIFPSAKRHNRGVNATETPGGPGIPAGWYDDPSGPGPALVGRRCSGPNTSTAPRAPRPRRAGDRRRRRRVARRSPAARPGEAARMRSAAAGPKRSGCSSARSSLVIVVVALLVSGGSDDNGGGVNRAPVPGPARPAPGARRQPRPQHHEDQRTAEEQEAARKPQKKKAPEAHEEEAARRAPRKSAARKARSKPAKKARADEAPGKKPKN